MPQVHQHEAVPYAGRSSFVATCAGIVAEGLAREERLLVLAQAVKIDDLRDELGGVADEIAFVTTDEHGRNPSRVTTMLHSFQATGDGRQARGVSETIVRGASQALLAEARLAEAVLNDQAVRAWPMSLLCLYDTDSLEPDDLESMRRSHPSVRGLQDNPDFDPDLAQALFATPFDSPPAGAQGIVVHDRQLTEMRSFVRRSAAGLGVGADRIDDLVLAANEIVTNSFRYGGGSASLSMWREGGVVVCEVVDQGFLSDPLIGRLAPPPAATSGRGLWMANHLCDLVQVRSSLAGGTAVRMHVDG